MSRLAGIVAAFGLIVSWGASAPVALGAERMSPYIVPAVPGSVQLVGQRVAMPDLVFADASGSPQHLSHWKGQVVVLNFWATWCGPCLREMPSLDALQGKAGTAPLAVLALSEDRGGAATVKAFFARQKYSKLKPFVDPNMSVAETLGVRGLPTTFIIDKRGRMVTKVEGPYQWDGEAIVSQLGSLLEE